MEEETNNKVNLKLFRYNMYICFFMLLFCLMFAVLTLNKTYICPKGTYMLRDKHLCIENPNTFEATLDDHNKDTYKIVLIVSSVILSISTIIYCAMIKQVENSGQYGDLMRSLNN